MCCESVERSDVASDTRGDRLILGWAAHHDHIRHVRPLILRHRKKIPLSQNGDDSGEDQTFRDTENQGQSERQANSLPNKKRNHRIPPHALHKHIKANAVRFVNGVHTEIPRARQMYNAFCQVRVSLPCSGPTTIGF